MESNYQRILELLRPNIIILPEGDSIIDQSFQEQIEVIKPLQKRFKEGLENYTVTEEDAINELSCAICLESFQINDIVIKLPCEGMNHFFHRGENKGECEGILPWFDQHNTCPICRTEFPAEPEPEPEPEPGPEPEPEPGPELPGPSIINTAPLIPEQIAGIHISQDNILHVRNNIDDLLRTIMEERNN